MTDLEKLLDLSYKTKEALKETPINDKIQGKLFEILIDTQSKIIEILINKLEKD